jgi:hypothetical protein
MTDLLTTLGNAVHSVLVHLEKHPLGFDERFDGRITHIEATTPHWSRLSKDYQRRVRLHWWTIARLYMEANSIKLELEGADGYRPDIVRRMGDVWEIIEIKVSDSKQLRKHSRKQVLDMANRMHTVLPAKTSIKGYRYYLPVDLEMSATPVISEILI